MSRTVSGVNVVTTDGPAGRFGLTVSAFAPVSADPPMVLVCVHRRGPACQALRYNAGFCVNVLAADQAHIADAFAGRPRSGASHDFTTGTWVAADSRQPRLSGACAALDCVLETAHRSGSHAVFVGRVIAVTPGSGEPLLYWSRSYGRPAACDRLHHRTRYRNRI